jgi:hypothetical protein
MPHSFWRWRPAIEASGRCRGKEASQLLYSGTAFLSPECICRRTDGRTCATSSLNLQSAGQSEFFQLCGRSAVVMFVALTQLSRLRLTLRFSAQPDSLFDEGQCLRLHAVRQYSGGRSG